MFALLPTGFALLCRIFNLTSLINCISNEAISNYFNELDEGVENLLSSRTNNRKLRGGTKTFKRQN